MIVKQAPDTPNRTNLQTPPSAKGKLPQVAVPQRVVRRTITPQVGHALEVLGHAIEYLTDEYVHDRGYLNPDDERMEAVQLLMQLNRRVYAECPELPSLSDRCRAMLHRVFRHNLPHSPLA